jgi:hypothetical protein
VTELVARPQRRLVLRDRKRARADPERRDVDLRGIQADGRGEVTRRGARS